MKRSEIFFGIIKIPLDFFLSLLAFILAYRIRLSTDLVDAGIQTPADLTQFKSYDDYFVFSIFASLTLISIFALNKMYSLKNTIPFRKQITKLFYLWLIWLAVIISYFFSIRELPFSRLVFGYSFGLTLVILCVGRFLIFLIQRFLLHRDIGRRRVLFIGKNSITNRIYSSLKDDKSLQFLGILDNNRYSVKINELKIIGKITDIEKIIQKNKIDEIIQTKSDSSDLQALDILNFCERNHINYSFVPDLIQFHIKNIDLKNVADIPLISLKPTPLDGWQKVIKRIFDVIGAIFGLIVLSPLLLTIAIAIKIDSKGTVLFKYLDDGSPVKRVGKEGELFKFYKFRTMIPNCHNMRYTKLKHLNIRKDSPMVKIKNDPRVTKLGKFLRKYTLDELPQLWNVLKGDMSLVGPRAHFPEEVDRYKPHQRFVLTLKPGITGLAQINGRSDLNFEEEFELDSSYIKNWTLWKDIKIILKTPFVMKRDKAD